MKSRSKPQPPCRPAGGSADVLSIPGAFMIELMWSALACAQVEEMSAEKEDPGNMIQRAFGILFDLEIRSN